MPMGGVSWVATRIQAWASVIRRYGGLRSVSDRIRDLDEWGLEATRQVLTTPPPTPSPFLPELAPR